MQAALDKYCHDSQADLDLESFVEVMLNMSAEIDAVVRSEQGELFFEESNLRAIYEQIHAQVDSIKQETVNEVFLNVVE